MKLLPLKNSSNIVIKKGFTLIETLVAITILMLAVTGPLVISQKGLSAAGYAKDQMIAYYLAQDAMEYVRNVRDTNTLSGAPDWLSISGSGLLAVCNGEKCGIDTRPTSESVISCTQPCLLNKNTSGNDFSGYGYGSGEKTIFTRTVYIVKPNGNPLDPTNPDDIEARVTVKVSWQTFSGVRDVILAENLFKQS